MQANSITSIHQQPHALRENASIIDPALLYPFFESICDNANRIKVTINNPAGSCTSKQTFYDLRNNNNILKLRNKTGQLDINLNQIFTAWVIDPTTPHSKIRLCNNKGDHLLAIEDASEHDHPCNSLWVRLVRALIE